MVFQIAFCINFSGFFHQLYQQETIFNTNRTNKAILNAQARKVVLKDKTAKNEHLQF